MCISIAFMLIATMDIVCANRKSRHIRVANDSKRARASEKITLCTLVNWNERQKQHQQQKMIRNMCIYCIYTMNAIAKFYFLAFFTLVPITLTENKQAGRNKLKIKYDVDDMFVKFSFDGGMVFFPIIYPREKRKLSELNMSH